MANITNLSRLLNGIQRQVDLTSNTIVVGAVTVSSGGNVTLSGGGKVTGLAAPTTNGDALRFDQLGANSGIATLDSGGKVPLAQLPASLMEYQGTWNATTNTPTLADGTGVSGYFYRVNVAGTQNLGSGSQTFVVGDWVMYDGAVWQLAHSGADIVVSVNGAAGVVTVNAINQLTGDVTTSAASQSQSEASTVAKIQGTTVSGTTGTGNVMFSASPTTTGTLTAAAITASGAISGSNLSGTNTGDQTITLTGDVTGSGTGSFAASVAQIQGTVVSGTTGTTDVVFSNSPTLVTPALGTPSALVGTNISGTASSLTSGITNALASATTTVSVSSATAPTSGQVLTATSGTAATWQTPASNPSNLTKSVILGTATLTANTTYAVRWAKSGETAGRVYVADYDTTSADNFHSIGFVQAGGSGQAAGDTLTLQILGAIPLASADTAFGSTDIGKPVYLASSGAFSVTVPSTALQAIVIIGYVEDTTHIDIKSIDIQGVL